MKAHTCIYLQHERIDISESLNIKCENYLTMPKYQAAKQKLQDAADQWEEYLESLPEPDRAVIEDYLDCMDEMTSQSEQRAYVQGYVDCVQVLGKPGLLGRSSDVVISNMKD